IYVLPADGNGAEIELVRTTGRNSSPIWTADGNHVLFKSDRNGSFGVWAVPVSDGKAAGPAARVIAVNLAPIAATRTGASYYLTGSNDESVSIVESTGQRGASDRIAGSNPMWSPDGKSIALLRQNSAVVFANRFDLIVHSLDTGEEKRFAREGIHGAAVWYRDGRSLLIAAGPALYRVDVTTGEFTEVLPAVADEYRGDAVLSADEKTLYFVARSATKWAIVAADLTTRQERDVLVLERPVARDGRNVRSLFLSPNGKSIAFGWRDYDTQLQHVDSVDVDGTHHREVATIPQSQPIALFGWSRDGGALEFLDQQGRIMRMPAIGGTADFTGVKLAVERFAAARPSPDGTRFAVVTSGEVSELWAIDNIPALLKARR
ncbi:MAG: PD40 domain-containing protein, partial [Acidobacteria bacterium]|nr:PD40 domain-containing protein [Acidobacteriota bacterium]